MTILVNLFPDLNFRILRFFKGLLFQDLYIWILNFFKGLLFQGLYIWILIFFQGPLRWILKSLWEVINQTFTKSFFKALVGPSAIVLPWSPNVYFWRLIRQILFKLFPKDLLELMPPNVLKVVQASFNLFFSKNL